MTEKILDDKILNILRDEIKQSKPGLFLNALHNNEAKQEIKELLKNHRLLNSEEK